MKRSPGVNSSSIAEHGTALERYSNLKAVGTPLAQPSGDLVNNQGRYRVRSMLRSTFEGSKGNRRVSGHTSCFQGNVRSPYVVLITYFSSSSSSSACHDDPVTEILTVRLQRSSRIEQLQAIMSGSLHCSGDAANFPHYKRPYVRRGSCFNRDPKRVPAKKLCEIPSPSLPGIVGCRCHFPFRNGPKLAEGPRIQRLGLRFGPHASSWVPATPTLNTPHTQNVSLTPSLELSPAPPETIICQ